MNFNDLLEDTSSPSLAFFSDGENLMPSDGVVEAWDAGGVAFCGCPSVPLH